MSLLLAAGSGATTYTYTASGGIITGGAALVSKTKDYPVSGGATTSGAATLSKTKDYLASGGAQTGGAATLAKTKDYPVSGGAQSGGAAPVAKTKDYPASGGASSGGAAVTSTQAAAPAATGGGRVLRPLFIPRRPMLETVTVYAYAPAGGVSVEGSALAEHAPVPLRVYTFEGRAAMSATGAAGTQRHPFGPGQPSAGARTSPYAQARAEDEEILILLAA